MPGWRAAATRMPLIERKAEAAGARRARLLDPVAAWYCRQRPDRHATARQRRPHGRIAFKTGTSYGYRDAWAVGFDGQLTIGVWVGRPDGAPVPGLVGRTGAAPILFDAFARSGHGRRRWRLRQRACCSPPTGQAAAAAATLHLGRKLQRRRRAATHHVSAGRRRAGAGRRPSGRPGCLEDCRRGRMPLTVMVNGVPVPSSGSRRSLTFSLTGPVSCVSTVMDARGAPTASWSGCSKAAHRPSVELAESNACAYCATGANESSFKTRNPVWSARPVSPMD